MHGLATSTTSTWQCVVVPGENTPELAVTKDDLNTGGHYNRPLYGPHALEEPLLKDGFD